MTANYSEEGADRVPCDISATGHQFKGSLATAGLFDWAEIDDDLRGDQRVEFADPREAEFARALDAHHISWRYKSRTFAVDWDDEGNFVDSFTPDFYLPDYGQYVELDTADQSLTEKNRGLRLLRRHQPWIKIELVRRSEYDESIEQFASIGKWRYSTR